MLALGSITFASAQTAPAFRSGAQLQLIESSGAETVPPAGTQSELFGNVPAFRTDVNRMPKVPRTVQPMPGTVQPLPAPEVSVQVKGAAAARAAAGTSARARETPIAFQRHPSRNLVSPDDDAAFTFRTTTAAGVLGQIRVGVQTDVLHTDNLSNTARNRAIDEVVMDLRPIIKLNLGSLPAGSADETPRSEYYLELLYTPTQQTLVDRGTSRMLQRLSGEVGRASPVFLSAVRFEYDENISSISGDGTVEDVGTLTEISPVFEYSLSAKTTLHLRAIGRRIASQGSSTNRTDYIFQTGMAVEQTAKTTIGAGLEFGHIPFDQAQFGEQNYQQAYASMVWKASPKLRFQTRAGVELREFDRPLPKAARVTPVASMVVNWTPNPGTLINAGFRVRNEPSVSKVGATFQEIRFGTDATYRVGQNWYVKGEAALIQRNYDSGTKELESYVRPAFGFRSEKGRLFDSLNVEIYYQFRRLDSNQRGADRDRNLFGIESTLYF